MRTIFIISFISLVLGCSNPKDDFFNRVDGNYYESLFEQNLYSVSDSLLLSIGNGKLAISKKHPFIPNSTIMFHEINANDSFINKDFQSAVLKVDSAQIKNGPIIYYGINYGINVLPNTKIRIGEYFRNQELKPINIWSTEIHYKVLKDNDNLKKAIEFLGANPKTLFMSYIKDKGVFFKTSGDLYLWIIDKSVFVIRKKILGNENKVMFHILKENSFDNFDFVFKNKLSNKLLLSNAYEVAEIKVSGDFFSHNIRIGEYIVDNLKNVNIWAQQINMQEVQNNELLKFNNEIEEAQAE